MKHVHIIQNDLMAARPIKMWIPIDQIEEGALKQAENLAKLPFTFGHVAIMPDTHQGYGMPIGSVLATKGVIVPNAVGVDIGCGMCSLRTSIRVEELPGMDLNKLMNLIQKRVPVGFARHQKKQSVDLLPDVTDHRLPELGVVMSQLEEARFQVGTLGGGNHFIEIQRGSDGFVWIMIHSGSRNIGFKTAEFHNKMARDMNDAYFSSIPANWELAFLPLDSIEGQNYLAEMRYATDFALANRMHMMELVKECIQDVALGTEFDHFINKPHNFAELENHFGENVMVHRKGACRAREGEWGMIPGSQGARSYIVQGKGERNSFQSCSHGAGRKLGRKAAISSLDLQEQQNILEELGVLHTLTGTDRLDEAPGAYKDITQVMENQKDLVEIKVELLPVLTIKG